MYNIPPYLKMVCDWQIYVNILCVCFNSYAYSVDYGTVVNTNYAHDNSVTCICWKMNILATGSLDCTVKVCVYLLTEYCHTVTYINFVSVCNVMNCNGGS